jgi:non-homologous end joining protein Ku
LASRASSSTPECVQWVDTAPASNVVNIMDALRKSVADELNTRKAG